MAKFSQEFLRQAASPMGSVQGGLLSAVGGAATLPQQLREREKAKALQTELSKLTPGSPEYMAALAKSQVGKGMFTEAGATGAAAIQAQQAADKAAKEKERRGRLMGQALQKAARSDDPANNTARVRNMTAEQLMEYLTPKERDTTVISAGGILADTDTGEILARAPFKQQNTLFNDLLKSGKYDPTTVKRDAEGNVDTSALRLAKDPKERGSIPPNVEKRIIAMDVDSGKATIEFGRARKLKNDLIAGDQKTEGVLSTLRTQVLDFAGLRDAEEQQKTDFLRKRNTDIVLGLPPGVASDTDVRIFSQGFPDATAGSAEIIRYLEAEEKILAAEADMSALFQQHVNKQVESGIEATTAGFEFERRKYANVMTEFRNTVENAVDPNTGNPLYSEEDKKRFLREALGFVPTYYSR
jgi:hypothetical protein